MQIKSIIIEQVHFHAAPAAARQPDLGLLLRAFATGTPAARKAADTPSAPARTVPAIRQPWPGVDGIYAGVSCGEDGAPDAHLVLLNAKPDKKLSRPDAATWVKTLGNDAHLPRKTEGALLYAHLREQLLADRWIWLEEQYDDSSAWYQSFDNGDQSTGTLSAEGSVRAVRRFPL